MVSQGAQVRGTLRHFFENMFCQKMKGYTFLKIVISCSNIRPLDAVSICVVKMFYLKNQIYVWGV